MGRGRLPAAVTLTDEERQRLTSLAHRSRSAPQLARRARIILACADGQPTTGITRRLHVSQTTVCKWRTRFLAALVDGLADEPRPGAPRRITDAQVEDVVVRTLELVRAKVFGNDESRHACVSSAFSVNAIISSIQPPISSRPRPWDVRRFAALGNSGY